MNIRELIDILGRCDPEMKVFVAYDSMVCISDLDAGDICLMEGGDPEYREDGLYLCAKSAGWRHEDGFKPIPK